MALAGLPPGARAQDAPPVRSALQVAAGPTAHLGREESGLGPALGAGYERALGARVRWRVSPQLVHGEFSAARLNDAGVAVHYDVLRYRALALVATGGAFLTCARGRIAPAEEPAAAPRRFGRGYVSGGGLGLRVSPAGQRLAYEIRPLTLHAGPAGFALAYATVGVALGLR